MHPEVAYRSCEDCQKWLYDLESGAVIRSGDKPVLRQPNNPPPCRPQRGRKFRGCPKGTPEQPLSLSFKNQQAIWHYRKCKATLVFPDDEIVRTNAAIIESAERQIDTLGAWELRQRLQLMHDSHLAILGSMTPIAT